MCKTSKITRAALSTLLLASLFNIATLPAVSEEIIAATHLASHREILNLHGIKKMAIGVSPLPTAITSSSDKSISAESLCDILSERAQSCHVEIEPAGATHLLLLTLSQLAKHDYQLVLSVRAIKKTAAKPLYTLKMRATMSGYYPKHLNELIERASIIFWRNYQLANYQRQDRRHQTKSGASK
ncbi:hypothetical protein BH11CYA1_BH11CYA1_02620 [soil metagenome]